MARALEVRSKTYDEAKLAAMVAPFNVRLEKIKGSQRTPIPLPEGDDGLPPGTGWGLEDVRGLEQWIVNEWCGGGLYEVSVTDSSPQPQTLKWQPYWDPKTYPEKTPPTLLDAASQLVQAQAASAPPPLVVVPPHQPQAGRMAPAFPNGLPQSPYYPPQYAQAPQPQYQQAPMGSPPMPGTYQWDVYQREGERREQIQREREREAELRREREAREKMERDAIAAQHTAALERERLANEQRIQAQAQQLAELRNMITGLASSIKDSASASRTSPELEAIKEQNRQMEAKMERERAEREAERREAATREAMRQMQDQMRQQMEMLQRQLDERARAAEQAARDLANANKGPDQMMLMWQQQQREQIELAKEMSRNQLTQMQALQNYMMNPRDIMAMAKESSASVDHATERVTNFFGRVIDTQQKVTENLLQMQPGSNGVVELVGGGIDKIGSLAERYLGGKQLEAQLAQQGQVQVAEAQARAYAAAVVAQTQTQAQPAEQAPQAQTQSAGLGNPTPAPEAKPATTAVPKKNKGKKPAATAPAANGNAIKRLGKTDEEWFGPIMPQIGELRTNAAKFIQSIKDDKVDKQGNPFGWNPEQAAAIIVQAVGVVVQRQVMVPILQELLFQDRFADFVDVLVPDPIVTQQYRDELVQAIVRAARIASGLPPEGEEIVDQSQGEDDDEPDADEDETDDPEDLL